MSSGVPHLAAAMRAAQIWWLGVSVLLLGVATAKNVARYVNDLNTLQLSLDEHHQHNQQEASKWEQGVALFLGVDISK
ncbi:hypothetical protein CVT25_008450 [Psilocybe cyanescens]|uniref:Uncharacterized protein n=1 Tax=Psilocybe cyanescens TaxID=93625 RepID=A0A409WUZ1_PSICY|nr:hypothetical protein CVT25_008450 [Psilocybe cyanescens]